MRHARPDDLAEIADLLARLRAVAGLVERTPGSFYRKSKGFLHFHVDGDDWFADVKLDGNEFERRRVTTRREQAALVKSVKQVCA